MSEILALAFDALVSLWHKAVNGCHVKLPGLRCEPVPHVLLNVVIQSESFAPQSLFQGTKISIITGGEVWTVWRLTKNLPLEFLQDCHDCVGHMRPCIVVEQNDPKGELAWSFRFDRLVKGAQGLQVTLLSCTAGSLSEGAVLVKEECQHNLSCT